MNNIYLGIAGIVSHDENTTKNYNELLEKLGTEGMLMQFERWVNAEELEQVIQFTKDNLMHNKIK